MSGTALDKNQEKAADVNKDGKIKATEVINGVIHAYNHEALGLPIVKAALSRFTKENAVIEYVLNMTKYHMKPGVMARAGSSIRS